MKAFYLFTMLLSVLFMGNLTAQSSFRVSEQESAKSIEIKRILDQYYQNQLLDNDLPPGWEFSTSDKVHIISVWLTSYPNLCDVPIEPGDYIGVFYIDDNGEEACGGAAMWTGTENVALVAYGDDTYTTEKDGFDPWETMTWYVYSYSLGEEVFPAAPYYASGYNSNNKFASGGLSIVEELEYFYENDIVIPAGWSGLSSFTKASFFPALITNVLSPISSELVLLQDMEKLYYPGAGINTMFVWTNGKGYKIKLTDEALLPMMGCPVDQTNVSLNATWNICPVLSKCNVLVSDVFNPILNNLIVIKEIGGNRIFWPDMGVQTLFVLEPGRAYYVAVTQNTSITYSDCQTYKSHPEALENTLINNTPWNTPTETGSSHTIAFPYEVLQSMNAGDYLAAFNLNGVCVGMSQIINTSETLPLTVYGDDPFTPDADGMQDGEKILFRVYAPDENGTSEAVLTFDGNYDQANGLYADNGLSVVSSMKFSATGLSEIGEGAFEIFPNPAENILNIRMNSNATYKICLLNMNGQQVLNDVFTGETALDVAHLGRGVYFVEIFNDYSKTTGKLVLK